ncbi:zinc finger, CCHC-type containing protein [Tanacetum coccineum]
MITPYEIWTKKKPNLNYLRVWGCREVVRLLDPKLKALGERGIECIFVGYVEHSKAFRFYVIEPNDSVIDGLVVLEKVTKEVVQQHEPELRKSKRHRTPKDFGSEFQLNLFEGTRDEVSDQHFYCFNVENDPKTFDEAMKSRDVAFWKEEINDEMDSIMGNNTWVLADLPPGCKPLGCKWIFKRKLKVDGNVEKFKARMAPKQWHQKFDEVVLSNGYLLNQADKRVYRKFDDTGKAGHSAFKQKSLNRTNFELMLQGLHHAGNENQADKSVVIHIDGTGKGVIICLYVDDMLIFGTNQVQVDMVKEFLSSRSSLIGEGTKKFNYFDCSLISTPMDTSEKLIPNYSQAVSQLEYSRVIGCFMYAMTCTKPDIAFVVGKLSMYTSNPVTQHWQAI